MVLAMLGFAMTLAFMTTPVFAWLNYRLVNRHDIPESLRGGPVVLWLSRAGLVYLIGLFLGTNLVALAVVGGYAALVLSIPYVRWVLMT